MSDPLNELQEKLGYFFRDRALLNTALTHSSYANENRALGVVCNERLEFLGDSVLGVTVASHLFLHYESMPEGRMTRLRSELVCEQSLHRLAQKLELGKYLLLGKGEESNGGRERPSILADAVEAIIAAVYLDGGREKSTELIHRLLLADLGSDEPECYMDYKTALQELIQRKSGQVLTYELIGEQGPDHDKTFSFRVLLNGENVGEGTGHSKKTAEQDAAHCALQRLKK